MDQEADLKIFRSQLCLIVSGILHFKEGVPDRKIRQV